MAGDPAALERIPGERGNPWVLPWNPGHIQIADTAQGGSWGLCGMAQPYRPPVVCNVFFVLWPDRPGMWNLSALFNFHGFFILSANKDWWNCRDSRVSVDVDMNVFQYAWIGNKHFSLLNLEQENGAQFGLFDEGLQFDYQAPLQKDDVNFAAVQVSISIRAWAYGAGSVGEINFAAGSANFIDPVMLLAWPS
jgi:hypothetical protein